MCYLTFKKGRGRPKNTLDHPPSPRPRKYHLLDLLRRKRLIDARMQEAGARFEQERLSYRSICRPPEPLGMCSLIRKDRGSGLKLTGSDSLKEIEMSQRYAQARTVLMLVGEDLLQEILSLLDEIPIAEEDLRLLLKRISLSKIRKGLLALWVYYRG